jgi:hypothetical protein
MESPTPLPEPGFSRPHSLDGGRSAAAITQARKHLRKSLWAAMLAPGTYWGDVNLYGLKCCAAVIRHRSVRPADDERRCPLHVDGINYLWTAGARGLDLATLHALKCMQGN